MLNSRPYITKIVVASEAVVVEFHVVVAAEAAEAAAEAKDIVVEAVRQLLLNLELLLLL